MAFAVERIGNTALYEVPCPAGRSLSKSHVLALSEFASCDDLGITMEPFRSSGLAAVVAFLDHHQNYIFFHLLTRQTGCYQGTVLSERSMEGTVVSFM